MAFIQSRKSNDSLMAEEFLEVHIVAFFLLKGGREIEERYTIKRKSVLLKKESRRGSYHAFPMIRIVIKDIYDILTTF